MQLKHTPTPWVARGSDLNPKRLNIVQDGQGLVPIIGIAEGNPNGEANAEFIVRACNSHEALVKDLQWIVERLNSGGRATISDCISQAQSAITKAGGAQ